MRIMRSVEWVTIVACLLAPVQSGCQAARGPDGGAEHADSLALVDAERTGDAAMADAGSPIDARSTGCSLAQQDCPKGSSCMISGDQPWERICFPGACDVVRQDCPAHQMCDYVLDLDGGVSARACIPAGTVAEGMACISEADCAPGLACTGAIATTCLRYCYTDGDCRLGTICAGHILFTGTREQVRLCVGQ
jgi:hypothetical protein